MPPTVRAVTSGIQRRVAAGALLGVVLVLSACSASGTGIRTPYGNTAAPALEHGPKDEVKTGTVNGLGTVLVDGQGMTLYLFKGDHRGSRSTCVGVCAVQWLSLTLPQGTAAPQAGPGIKPSLLGTSCRRDDPDHLQRLASLYLASGHRPRSGHRPSTDQPGRALVRGERRRRRHHQAVTGAPRARRSPCVRSHRVGSWATYLMSRSASDEPRERYRSSTQVASPPSHPFLRK